MLCCCAKAVDYLGTLSCDALKRDFSDGKGCGALFQCNHVIRVKCSWLKVGSISIIGKIYHIKAISKKVFLSDKKKEQGKLSLIPKT